MNEDNPDQPFWDTKIKLDIYDLQDLLNVSVFSSEGTESYQLKGSGRFRLSEWYTSIPKESVIQLDGDDGDAGLLYLEVRFGSDQE
jgi:hypothetical protein